MDLAIIHIFTSPLAAGRMWLVVVVAAAVVAHSFDDRQQEDTVHIWTISNLTRTLMKSKLPQGKLGMDK